MGIASGYGLDGRGLIPVRVKIFSSPQSRDRLRGPLSNCYQVLFSSGVKRPGHESGHSFSSRAEVKHGGAIPPLPHVSI
jgi:hypothetical protein